MPIGRSEIVIGVLGAALLSLRAAGDAHPTSLRNLAPADVYFGRMKISFIGIDNRFADTARDIRGYTTDSSVTNEIDFTLDALNDWRGRYPRDPQLARAYFLGQNALKKIWIKKYQDKAWAYMQLIRTTYPHTYFAKIVAADLARGYTENYFAAPAVCGAAAVPTPQPSPVAEDNGKYKTLIHAAPCVDLSPSPLPTSAAPSSVPLGAPGSAPSGAPSAAQHR
jgi:hypothetical protein